MFANDLLSRGLHVKEFMVLAHNTCNHTEARIVK
jgi:hypothetical protein